VRTRHLAALLAIVLVAGACADGDDVDGATAASTPSSASGDRDAAAPTNGGPAVPEQLDWVAQDVRGGEVVGAELAGDELVIWFWAPW